MAAPISTTAYTTPDDVTIANLESNRTTMTDAINNADGSRLLAGTVSTDSLTANANPENRWDEAFNNWVYVGLLPPTTSGTLTSTTTEGTAYIDGVRVVKAATNNTYTATKWTYVDISDTGTYTYPETTIGATEPSVTTDSIRLARVSSDATEITAVRDDRVLSISLGTDQDEYRKGLNISVVTPDAVTIRPGVVYHGTTRIGKTSDTTLDLGTASDWVSGVSQRGTSTTGYVVTNANGAIRLTTTAPTKSDISANSDGKLIYSVVDSTYYRVLSWFRMNATGSGNIDEYGYSDISELGSINRVRRIYTAGATGTGQIPDDDTIPQVGEGDEFMELSIVPTDADNVLNVDVVLNTSVDNLGKVICTLVEGSGPDCDAVAWMQNTVSNGAQCISYTFQRPTATTSYETWNVRAAHNNAGATLTFNGWGGNRKFGGTMASSITLTEIEDQGRLAGD